MSGCSSGVVVFNPDAFLAAYPGFQTVPRGVLSRNFSIAGGYLNNTASSPVRDFTSGGQRETLLFLLVAHITQLTDGINGEAPSGLVGRISSASEGSVSVSVEFPSNPNAAWYTQTQWGALYWTLTSSYRTARFIPGRVNNPANALGLGSGQGLWHR